MNDLNNDIMKRFDLEGLLLRSGSKHDAPILVAYSGGADSSLLLYLTSVYAKLHGNKIYVSHINHMIRGKDSDGDEEFCRRTAEAYGFEFFSLRADVPSLASVDRKSLEEKARDIRYSFFEKIMREHDIPVLLTAHNADDCLETLIFSIIRGCGIKGICGIPDIRDLRYGKVLRPILKFSKSDVYELCKERRIDFVTDKTNFEDDCSRNIIRLNVIPELRRIFPDPETNAFRAIESSREAYDLVRSTAEELIKQNVTSDCPSCIDTEALKRSHISVRKEAIVLLYACLSDKMLEKVHIDSILNLVDKGTPHSSVTLPDRINASIEESRLCFMFDTDKETTSPSETVFKIDDTDSKIVPFGDFLVTVSRQNNETLNAIPDIDLNVYSLYTDETVNCDTIVGYIKLRCKKDGDRIKTGKMSKQLKKLFCEKKIPLNVRQTLPCFEDSEGLFFVPNVCVADKVKCRENCVKINIRVYQKRISPFERHI